MEAELEEFKSLENVENIAAEPDEVGKKRVAI